MKLKSLITKKENYVLTIYLYELKKRNALTMSMRNELYEVLSEAERDENVRAIIITGKGKGFSAGGDLSSLKNMKLLEGRKRLQAAHPLIMKMLEIEKPIIAAVNGAAAGAGFSLTLLADLIIASEEAFFIQSFVHVGLMPDFAVLHFLPALIGPQRAKELMFLGERISAQEAYDLGIVNRIVDSDQLIKEAENIAIQLTEKAPISLGLTKRLLNEHMNKDLKVLLEMESQAQEICFQSEDFTEGVQAFFDKRKPEFQGN